jgi:membrane associated rhomboid family serine protease
METVSLVTVIVITITIAVLALRRYSPTMLLIASNVIIFAIGLISGHDHTVIMELGFKSDISILLEEPWNLITSMFVHSDITHLAFNMIFLLAIGIPLENRIGKLRFLIIYLLGGMVGTLTFMALEINSAVIYVLVGASGAISALMGAMIMLYPREKIAFFMGPILTNQFTVFAMVMVWFALQLFLFLFDDSPVAYAAHLGGFAAGALIGWVIRPRETKKEELVLEILPLKELCVTYSLKEMYDYAENADNVTMRDMWIEKILNEVVCPVCGSRVRRKRDGFECTEGHKI